MTEASMEVEDQHLEYILCIQYLVKFIKTHTKVNALIDSSSKVNRITLAYNTVLELHVCYIDVKA